MQNWRQLFAEPENHFDFLIHCCFVRAFVKQRTVRNPNNPNCQHQTGAKHRNRQFLVESRFFLQSRNATAERQRRLTGALTAHAINKILLFYAKFDALLAFVFAKHERRYGHQYYRGGLNLAPDRSITDCETRRQQKRRSEERVAIKSSSAEPQATVYVIYDTCYILVVRNLLIKVLFQ